MAKTSPSNPTNLRQSDCGATTSKGVVGPSTRGAPAGGAGPHGATTLSFAKAMVPNLQCVFMADACHLNFGKIHCLVVIGRPLMLTCLL